ncbi:hypothetical protein MNEG_15029 [Monoraphidium neglectum]|uniref:Uncharacterized protein n=1 Tax=Monoraphidium neglectum TaxID=145388 RepID=A0A0D2LM94_9CHLO|nr:hypothetical protein MNEG_15029 [Monoraphidium neglectum]KIY92934.1 hypothetical protein MNEG_15029 [Monoraphidium neglectum]|eukprot:XP_013891954.1 hypothetical protein MNEG_15029 [Monoraphidium neglectum]
MSRAGLLPGAGVGFNGGLTSSFDNFGNPVVNQGGRGQIFRRLGEQGAASANANIMAIDGDTTGFAPSDGARITNSGGMTTFTSAGVGFNGGLTSSFDNFGNPVVNQGGRGQIFRRLGEQGAAGLTSFTSAGVGFTGGLTTSFDNFNNPIYNPGGRGFTTSFDNFNNPIYIPGGRGLTTSFDNFNNPIHNQGGRGTIF